MYKGKIYSGSGSEAGFEKMLKSISDEGGVIQSTTANKYYLFIIYEVPDSGG